MLIQEASHGTGEPQRIVSLPIDQLDTCKPAGRGLAIGAAVEVFDDFLK